MIKKYGDIIVGGFYIVLSVALYIASLNIQSFVSATVGPKFLPQIIAMLFLLIGTALLIMGIKQYKIYEETKEVNDEVKPSYIRLALTLFLMALYIGLLKSVGFVPMTFIYIIAQIYLVTPREDYNKKMASRVLILSGVSSVALYYLFYNVFQVFLPHGIWF